MGSGSNPREMLANLLVRHSAIIIRACIRANAYWTLENPRSSLLFDMPEIASIISLPSTQSVCFAQCMYGLKEPNSELFYHKRTRIIGNLPDLISLRRECDHGHQHQQIVSNVNVNGVSVARSKLAGAYPEELCRALSRLVSHARDRAQQQVAQS